MRKPAMLLRLDAETQRKIREMAAAESTTLSAVVAALAGAEWARRGMDTRDKEAARGDS